MTDLQLAAGAALALLVLLFLLPMWRAFLRALLGGDD